MKCRLSLATSLVSFSENSWFYVILSERNLSGDLHDLAPTCTRQRKHTSVYLIWQREDVQRAEHRGDLCYAIA